MRYVNNAFLGLRINPTRVKQLQAVTQRCKESVSHFLQYLCVCVFACDCVCVSVYQLDFQQGKSST